MAYQSPKLNVVSLRVESSDYASGKDTASCCSSSCCFGAGDTSCNVFF